MSLHLNRKVGDKIRIGDKITLVVIEIRGDKVRLGIEAPLDVTIFRGELLPVDPRKLPPGRDPAHE